MLPGLGAHNMNSSLQDIQMTAASKLPQFTFLYCNIPPPIFPNIHKLTYKRLPRCLAKTQIKVNEFIAGHANHHTIAVLKNSPPLKLQLQKLWMQIMYCEKVYKNTWHCNLHWELLSLIARIFCLLHYPAFSTISNVCVLNYTVSLLAQPVRWHILWHRQ